MTACPTCNTQLDSNHPAVLLEQLLVWIDANGGWGIFEGSTYGRFGRVSNFVNIEIAALKTSYSTGDVDVEGYYGDSALPQGSEFKTYIVFKIGDVYYKKTGTGDSYGEVRWDGDIRIVEATTRTVLEFK